MYPKINQNGIFLNTFTLLDIFVNILLDIFMAGYIFGLLIYSYACILDILYI